MPPCRFKNHEQEACVIGGGYHGDNILVSIKAQLYGNIFAHCRSLCVRKVGGTGLIHLAFVGKEQQLGAVGGFKGSVHLVAVLELVLGGHSQRLGSYLLEISAPCDKEVYGIIGNILLRLCLFVFVGIAEQSAAGLTVFLDNVFQLGDDDIKYLLSSARMPSISAMSFSSWSTSEMRFRIYSLLR